MSAVASPSGAGQSPLSGTVPGKLMVAGEYAVLRPDGLCVAAAVGQVARWQLAPPEPWPTLTLHAFDQTWRWPMQALLAEPLPTGLGSFAAGALQAAAAVWAQSVENEDPAAAARSFPGASITLQVSGSVGGAKLGLGTSAAVTVAVLQAAAAAVQAQPTAAEVAALARGVHHRLQNGQGSGYDVTTQALGGVVRYQRSPDRATRLQWPQGLHALALYTGEPAATQKHLDGQQPGPAALDAIADAARQLADAWSTAPADVLLDHLRAAEAAFDLAAADAPHLLPPSVRAVRETIAAAGAVARTSGAGGGDCVWAFASDPAVLTALASTWQAQGRLVVVQLPAHLAPEQGDSDGL